MVAFLAGCCNLARTVNQARKPGADPPEMSLCVPSKSLPPIFHNTGNVTAQATWSARAIYAQPPK